MFSRGIFYVKQISDLNFVPYKSLIEVWKALLPEVITKKGAVALSGLHAEVVANGMALRPPSTINLRTNGGQTLLTSFADFQNLQKLKQRTSLTSIPNHTKPLTGGDIYDALKITTSIPDKVLHSCFLKKVSDLGPERFDYLFRIYGRRCSFSYIF
jgi:hypothetical protein